MLLIKPLHLNRGDRVAVVSPSWGGPAAYPARYALGRRVLEERLGVQVVEMPNALAAPGWLAQNPAARAADLHAAFCDPSVRAVIASIGGDDAIRLIPHLDLNVIVDNPKIFLGYSDSTAIHFACLTAGLASFYGPSVIAGFAENVEPFAYTLDSVNRMLFEAAPLGRVEPNRGGWTDEVLDWGDPQLADQRRTLQPSSGPSTLQGRGTARGPLIGGCAEVLEMLKGTPWWPPLETWRGAIFFYETSEEGPKPACVLRWLRNFAAQGILQVLSGIVLGRPGGGLDLDARERFDKTVVAALVEARLSDLPVIANMDFGHTDPMFTLPYGVVAELDCDGTTLTLCEAAVR